MRIKIIFITFLSLTCTQFFAQRAIYVLDSLSGRPLVGVAIQNLRSNEIAYTDTEGKGLISTSKSDDSILISSLGYQRLVFRLSDLLKKVYLSAVQYQLREAIIKPIQARDYIQMAFDSFHKNHVPFPFSQKVFYREEFIVNNDYLRFQEMDMEVYQDRKSVV